MKGILGRFLQRRSHAKLENAERKAALGQSAELLQILREFASAGDTDAQLRLGEIYEKGQGVVQDLVEAHRWYRSAAIAERAEAQAKLGEIYLAGFARRSPQQMDGLLGELFNRVPEVQADAVDAAHWSRAAAEQGHSTAQARLGFQYANGVGVEQDHAEAERWLNQSAEQDDELGLLLLGMLLSGAFGTPIDPPRAAEVLSRAVEKGNTTAQLCLALQYMNGNGVSRDEAKGFELMSASAEAGNAPAMYYLGEFYRYGRGVAQSADRAETWLRRASAPGHVTALLALTRLMISRDESFHAEAAVICRQAAELGSAEAQHLLAELYMKGVGVPRDLSEALRWANRSADLGYVPAFEQIGSIYREPGPLQDFSHAETWLKQAQDAGDVRGLVGLGFMRLRGEGGPVDPMAAINLWTEASSSGSAEASLQLGILYGDSDVVPRDYVLAAHWYQRSADQGSINAKYNLAFLYLKGLGVTSDIKKGAALLGEVADRGNAMAAWTLYCIIKETGLKQFDDVDSSHWLLRAAELGSEPAIARLAQLFDEREAGLVDADKVVPIVQKQADRGDIKAQVMLAHWLAEGQLVKPDIHAAVHWYRRAAEQGDAVAQYNLGRALKEGLGTNIDQDAADIWFERAALQGHSAALSAVRGARIADD